MKLFRSSRNSRYCLVGFGMLGLIEKLGIRCLISLSDQVAASLVDPTSSAGLSRSSLSFNQHKKVRFSMGS